MSKILMIATGPLLEDGVRFFSGQCLRTLQFAQPLIEAGHEIDLYTHPISAVGFEPSRDPIMEGATFEGLKYHRFNASDEAMLLDCLHAALERFRPDALLGVNAFPSHLACCLKTDLPVWCDLNGYALVEAQTRARVYDDDWILGHFHRYELSVARRADRFSTVSTPQKHALLGELALVGRMSRFTFDYEFASVIPNAVARRFVELGARTRAQATHDSGEFRILWSGGFNTWTDIDTLVDGVTRAMERDPSIRFVATGGAIDGHDERTYHRFRARIEASPLASRFDLRGWVEAARVDELLLACDLGINIDARNYETLFGARNRLTTMLACGLPILTTRGTEISRDLIARGLAIGIDMGDAVGLAGALCHAAAHRDDLRAMGRRGRDFALAEYDARHTIRECLEWMKAPAWAPDNAERVRRGGPLPLPRRPLNAVEAPLAALDETPLDDLLRDRRDLRLLRSRRLFKVAKSIKNALGRGD